MSLQPSSKPRRRTSRRTIIRWIKRGVLIALGVAVIAAIVIAWLPKPVPVDVGVARRIALDVEVDEDGQTRVRDRFVVAAPIGGTLQRIELDAGAQVEVGDVIARIEPPAVGLLDERSRREAAARLAAARAREPRAATAVARAKVAREAAARDTERARALFEGGAISGADRERAELAEQLAIRDLGAAETDRASAAAEAAAIQAQLAPPPTAGAHATVPVTAPVRGEVLKVVRDSAGPVAAGAALVELGDVRSLEVVVDVLSSDAAQIRTGMPVAIEGWGGDRPLVGEVARVEPSAFTKISALGVEEQRVNVIVALASPPTSLGDGFRVDARIFTWRGTNVLAIPGSAVFRDRGHWAVYAIDGGKARLRRVELGHRGRLEVEVISGLAAGQQVVLHPSDRIRDGVEVSPQGTP
jgi:HlyD family secretion protein